MASFTHSLVVFIVAFAIRYLRVLVGIFANVTCRSTPIPLNPTYSPEDVSVIIPTTYNNPVEFIRCVFGIVRCGPAAIIVVTSNAKKPSVQKELEANGLADVKVLGVERLNKRVQILEALPHIKNKITVLADDDVHWPDRYLHYLLAIFEDQNVGAGGTLQRVRRDPNPSTMNFLGICYLERRVWNNIATNTIDGSISTLSGRTAAYRTSILNTTEFAYYFSHDTWFGKPLNSDDDKCLTRYVYSHGWQIKIQTDSRAVIETTVEQGWKYLSQCMRWARAHWRGNFTVMTNESYWRSMRYIWGFFVIYVCQFMTPAALCDGLLAFLWHRAVVESKLFENYSSAPYVALASWVLFTKIVKLLPHFWRHPSDIKFIPAAVLFSYFHGIINVYALLTLNVTHWGSQQLNDPAPLPKDGTGSIVSSSHLASQRMLTEHRDHPASHSQYSLF